MAGRNVSYVKQKTPSFIQKFKEQVGYKEGPDVETKRSTDISDTLDDNELEDEKPAVVLANNVSEVEATKFLEKLEAEKNEREQSADQPITEGGKIMFKKPTKRKSDGEQDNPASKKKDCKKPSRARSNMKEVKNRTLLSFDDEEEA